MVADAPHVPSNQFSRRKQPTTRAARYASPVRQLLNLQEVMFKTACDPQTMPRDMASCARVWCELEKLRMVKLGKPIVIGSPSVSVKLPRMRKFGRLASIIDVAPTTKAPENT